MLINKTQTLTRPLIRPAVPSDCETVRGIARAAYALYLPRMDREPAPMLENYEARAGDRTLYVLEAERGIVGFIILIPENDAMLLDNVAIAPDAQGKGYGRMLIEFAEGSALAAGAAELRLYTNEIMHENLVLYTRLGFVETSRAEEKGYRRIFMSKKLSN